jgi:hypothetical protein
MQMDGLGAPLSAGGTLLQDGFTNLLCPYYEMTKDSGRINHMAMKLSKKSRCDSVQLVLLE